MTRLFCLLLLCAGCATPSGTGLSQELPPALMAKLAPADCLATGTACVEEGIITWATTDDALALVRGLPSLSAQRDEQTQAEQENADLARYLGTQAWTLAGCFALVFFVMVLQARWRKHQERR